ncbi:MAG: CRISPR-associated endonuclease Cas2 [Burkholderiales bacterium]|jgi:CRISPR-associated protein Cas2|nr:CRISPR-associated endonuclease Cas2 [Burkholderiales bacterium]
MAERLYLVAYDIRSARRWRRLYRLLQGYGSWVQLSVFQCRLSPQRHAELSGAMDTLIDHREDQVLLVDLGPVETAQVKFASFGRRYREAEVNPVVL